GLFIKKNGYTKNKTNTEMPVPSPPHRFFKTAPYKENTVKQNIYPNFAVPIAANDYTHAAPPEPKNRLIKTWLFF
ncbi:hypothetical protein ACQWHW_27050, partial [Salmonella enterica subsp. enterica serovar Infantis]